MSAPRSSTVVLGGKQTGSTILSVGLGLLLLAPFVWYYSSFRDSFWFGDEFDLMREIADVGLLRWSIRLFSENFSPVFKLIWGGLLFIGNGNYLVMLGAMWITHAFNGYLLARALSRLRFGWIAAAGTVVTFGLTGITIETLTWSVQLCVVLSSTFFLLSLEAYTAADDSKSEETFKRRTRIDRCGSLTFSRGIAAGPVLALVNLCQSGFRQNWIQRIKVSLTLSVIPIATAALIFFAATGTHHAVANGKVSLINVAAFGGWAFGLNPIARYFLIEPSALAAISFGILKLLLMGGAIWKERGARRSWFLGIALFEISNCTLLGIGRYNPQLGFAASSRYEYSSLFTTAPFVGYWLEQLISPIKNNWGRAAIASPVLFWLGMKAFMIWGQWLPGWVASRGTAGRELLIRDDTVPQGHDVPGIPGMNNRQAQKLARRFDLH